MVRTKIGGFKMHGFVNDSIGTNYKKPGEITSSGIRLTISDSELGHVLPNGVIDLGGSKAELKAFDSVKWRHLEENARIEQHIYDNLAPYFKDGVYNVPCRYGKGHPGLMLKDPDTNISRGWIHSHTIPKKEMLGSLLLTISNSPAKYSQSIQQEYSDLSTYGTPKRARTDYSFDPFLRRILTRESYNHCRHRDRGYLNSNKLNDPYYKLLYAYGRLDPFALDYIVGGGLLLRMRHIILFPDLSLDEFDAYNIFK